MALELKRAQRSKAYLKLGISAPSGGGKTLGSLLIGYGLMKQKYPNLSDKDRWEKIAIIDTENRSGELYVGRDIAGIVIGEYRAITLKPPFEADKYTEAIKLCEENEIEVCIIDSTTHLWSGAGGLLEQKSNIEKRTNNSYTAWRDVTPQHSRFIDAMLQTSMHVIATMRAKQEYVVDRNEQTGKTSVRKLGLEPEQRKGMEYEFTIFLEVDSEHNAFGSKDRTSIFDQRTFKISPSVGVELMKWLDGGVDTVAPVVATSHKADPEASLRELKDEVVALCKTYAGGELDSAMREVVKKFAPNGNPNSISDMVVLKELQVELIDLPEAVKVA